MRCNSPGLYLAGPGSSLCTSRGSSRPSSRTAAPPPSAPTTAGPGHISQRIASAESAGERELLVAVRSHPRRRADQTHDLEGGERDTASDAPDQNVIALLDASARHDHSPRG